MKTTSWKHEDEDAGSDRDLVEWVRWRAGPPSPQTKANDRPGEEAEGVVKGGQEEGLWARRTSREQGWPLGHPEKEAKLHAPLCTPQAAG